MYKIELSHLAEKEIENIYKKERKLFPKIISAIESLKTNPYKGKKLKGQLEGDYSLRVWTYRIIYTIQNEKLIIYIIDVGHRREVYK
ncbi:MAG: type II toxin-antitoxin system RelE/ParE family toxin [Candidatus Ratteibacteria bacterium]|nr:type II toxin-antitoxin system RelE/ParE family toxin [Candidatus Ratteibacteria bacterium]